MRPDREFDRSQGYSWLRLGLDCKWMEAFLLVPAGEIGLLSCFTFGIVHHELTDGGGFSQAVRKGKTERLVGNRPRLPAGARLHEIHAPSRSRTKAPARFVARGRARSTSGSGTGLRPLG